MIHVVLPVYNEGGAAARSVRRIGRVLGGAGLAHRTIVVDDASTDGTAEALTALAHDDAVVPLRNPRNLGYGGALAVGLDEALDGARADDVIVTMDGDDTHPPEAIPAMAAKIADGATIVIASRYLGGSRSVGYSGARVATSRLGNGLYRRVLRLGAVTDYTNGFRAYAAGLLATAAAARGGSLYDAADFSAATELLLNLADRPEASIREIPFSYRYDRKAAPSKLDVGPTAARHLRLLARTARARRRGRAGTGGGACAQPAGRAGG